MITLAHLPIKHSAGKAGTAHKASPNEAKWNETKIKFHAIDSMEILSIALPILSLTPKSHHQFFLGHSISLHTECRISPKFKRAMQWCGALPGGTSMMVACWTTTLHLNIMKSILRQSTAHATLDLASCCLYWLLPHWVFSLCHPHHHPYGCPHLPFPLETLQFTCYRRPHPVERQSRCPFGPI